MDEKAYFKSFVGTELIVFIASVAAGIVSYLYLNPALLVVKALLVTLGITSTVTIINVVRGTIEHINTKRRAKKQCNFKDDPEIMETLETIYKSLDEVEKREVMTNSKLKQVDEKKNSKPKQLVLTKDDIKNR